MQSWPQNNNPNKGKWSALQTTSNISSFGEMMNANRMDVKSIQLLVPRHFTLRNKINKPSNLSRGEKFAMCFTLRLTAEIVLVELLDNCGLRTLLNVFVSDFGWTTPLSAEAPTVCCHQIYREIYQTQHKRKGNQGPCRHMHIPWT